jgi:phosphoglycerate dehydrogenase-like enzyme
MLHDHPHAQGHKATTDSEQLTIFCVRARYVRFMEEIVVGSTAISEGSFERLRAEGHIPDEVRLVVIDDDGRPPSEEAARAVTVLWSRRADFGGTWVADTVGHLGWLRWLHTDTVGIEHIPVAELGARGVTVTNGAGNFARPMAEWCVLAMLAAAKHLPDFVRRSDAGVWDASPTLRELDGSVALVLGLGHTGRLVAELAAAFGVDVRALVRRTDVEPPPGVTRLVSGTAWRDELREADWVVLGLPLTEQTHHIIDAEALAVMKPDAWLINPARGALIDEDALVAALDAGRIGGAVLDAFAREPLPPSSRLWGRENVVVVPHHTWSSDASWRRMEDLFAAQLSRWLAREPMHNVIHPDTGY